MKGILMRLFTVIALFALAVAPAAAASKGSPNRASDAAVAEVDISRDVIVWEPLVDYRQVSLRVTGASGVFERTFEPGETIYFDFVDAEGSRLLDGLYRFELVASPVNPASREDDAAAGLDMRSAKENRNTQSGYFTIEGGMAALPDLNEDSISFRTFVDTMDRVIQGSLCVGVDCPSAPSFGFDTIRLQENNLRIHFDDTSTSASFPNNDWRIVINDSANGGANKFTIEDSSASRSVFTIEAGALSNSLYVDDGGRIGRKTSTPVVEFHIVDGDSPTVRLEQDGSSGFTPQTWDMAGNETNFFVRDVTNGSKLPFRIRPSAPSNSIYIDTDGDIGIGTTSFDGNAAVQIARSGDVRLEFDDTSANDSDWTVGSLSASDVFRWSASGTGGNEMTIGSSGDITFNAGATNNMTLQGSTGNVTFRGTGTFSAKPFKIDHPLDPANKYLWHTAIESPDMTNLYNGNVELDANGEAIVQLPDWFEALNRDFRYQLTPIGAPAPSLYVAEEVSANQFKIAGGEPGMRVSWQLTGIRHDAWADAYRIPVEQDKPANERGTYIHPELFEKQAQRAEGAAAPATQAPAPQPDKK